LEEASKAVALAPDDYVPLVWRGYIQQRLGNRKAAVADFAAAIMLPNSSDRDKKNIRLIMADAAISAGDAEAAEAALAPLRQQSPDVAARARDVAGVLEKRRTLPKNPRDLPAPVQDCPRGEGAVVCVLKAAPPRSVLVALPPAADRAYAAQRKNNYPLAIREAERAVADNPEKVEYHLLLANLLLTSKRYQEAEAAADAGLKRDKSNAQLLAARGFARAQLNNMEGALGAC